MHPQHFVMISKAFSDGISMQKNGPLVTKEYSSESIFEGGKSFRTAACFIPKLVAKHFVTTLTVGDELMCYESIAFERQTVLQSYSETTNIFPKEQLNRYCSLLVFQQNSTKKHFISGIDLLPAQKIIVVELNGDHHEADKPTENGDIVREN